MVSRAKVSNIIAGLVLLIVISGVGAVFWSGSTKEIIAAADSLHIPSDWKKVDENIEPPRLMCLGSAECPSVRRTYDFKINEDSRALLQKVLPSNATSVSYYGPCGSIAEVNSRQHIYLECSITFKSENKYKHEIAIYHVGNAQQISTNVRLSL